MPNYQQGKIYKIECHQTGEIYVGSTVQPTLARRVAKYVDSWNCWKKGKTRYMTSFQILERGQYDITLLELYPCNSKDELTEREKHYIKTTKCINKVIPKRTRQEHRADNIEKFREYERNRDRTEYTKLRYQKMKDNEEFQKISKTRHSDYYQKTKEEQSEKKKLKIDCVCGSHFRKSDISRHIKSQKHITFINSEVCEEVSL